VIRILASVLYALAIALAVPGACLNHAAAFLGDLADDLLDME
jgi:hypothetical protein